MGSLLEDMRPTDLVTLKLRPTEGIFFRVEFLNALLVLSLEDIHAFISIRWRSYEKKRGEQEEEE